MLDIGELSTGERIHAPLAVRATRGLAPYAEGFYLTMTLGNATGEIPAKVWLGPDEDHARELDAGIDVGDVLAVEARAREYRDRLELSIETPPEHVDPAQVDPRAFLPASDAHLGRLVHAIVDLARSIGDHALRELTLSVWREGPLRRILVAAPATKGHHRAHLGGLLEHAHATARLATTTAELAEGLDRDILLAGALLAPLGTLDELTWGAAVEITDAGRLLGPAALADDRLRGLLQERAIDRGRALRLRHIVRAANAIEGRGPASPRTPEAVVLAAIRRLDVDVARAVQAAGQLAEDGDTSGWPTGYGGYLDVASRSVEMPSQELPA